MAIQNLTPLAASAASLPQPDSPFSPQFSPSTPEFGFHPGLPSRSKSNSNSVSHSRDRLQPPSANTAQHFFATVVQSNRSLLPLFIPVVTWMLKRDLLVTLHLHVRVVASVGVKKKCRADNERERAERLAKWSEKNARFQPPARHTRREKDGSESRGGRNRGPPLAEEVIIEDEGDVDEGAPPTLEEESGDGDGDPDLAKPSSFEGSPNWFSLSPREARRRTRRLPSTSSSREHDGPYMSRRRSSARDHLGSASRRRGRVADDVISENPFYESGGEDGEEDDVEGDDIEDEEDDSEDEDDENVPSIIPDPGRATPKERRWLTKMSEGKTSWVAKRFEAQVALISFFFSPSNFRYRINQYFDGKCTDDEILYHADISRRQLREVLHHYDEFVSPFFHSSISTFLFPVMTRARSPVHHYYLSVAFLGTSVRRIRTWRCQTHSKRVHMDNQGTMVSIPPTTNPDYLIATPWTWTLCSIPVPRDSLTDVVPLSESPPFEFRSSLHPFSFVIAPRAHSSTSTTTGLWLPFPLFLLVRSSHTHLRTPFPFAVTVVLAPVLAYRPAVSAPKCRRCRHKAEAERYLPVSTSREGP